jgi:L-fucose isomerase-like protein
MDPLSILNGHPDRNKLPVLGEENTGGALEGRTPAAAFTFGRISTDDLSGTIKAYVGEGVFTENPLNTFGTRAVAHVPSLQPLMQVICKVGFEHHTAMNGAHCAGALAEPLGNYLDWNVYHHKG